MNWDLSGSLVECLKRYAGSLSNEKREFLLQCLEEGLNERQIKRLLPLRTMEEMKLYQRIFLRTDS
jgi:type IV secretion system protein VirD4